MESLLKLKDILPNRKVYIEYRTHDPLGDDVLAGFCTWHKDELVSDDGDDYSVDDVISSYEWDGPDNLIVWYDSKWVTG